MSMLAPTEIGPWTRRGPPMPGPACRMAAVVVGAVVVVAELVAGAAPAASTEMARATAASARMVGERIMAASLDSPPRRLTLATKWTLGKRGRRLGPVASPSA